MYPQNNAASTQSKKSLLQPILIYIGIILGVNFVDSLVYNALIQGIYNLLGTLPHNNFSLVLLLSSIANTIVVCIVMGLLFQRLVFHSTKSPVTAIVLLCVLNVVRSFVVSFAYTLVVELFYDSMTSDFFYPAYQVVSFALTWGVHALCFVLQHRIYNNGSAANAHTGKVLSASNSPDPSIVTVDLEAIEKRNTQQERSRIFSADADRESRSGIFGRFDVENDSERVIAQSSRDAIRVMEHKELGIKHEWNCDDNDGSRQSTGSASQHVIVPGSGNPVHVTEHSALDMKHEWNCDERRNS